MTAKTLQSLRAAAPILFALVTGCAAPPPVAPAPGDLDPRSQAPGAGSGTFVLLHTNDFHGRYQPFHAEPGSATAQTGDAGQRWVSFDRTGLVGGFARLAHLVETRRAALGPERVALVHAGDTFSDDLLCNLTRGEAMIRLMNALEYDLAALGNHDFDYGLERTRALQALANFPMRAANVLEVGSAPPGRPFLGTPFRIVERGGVRVALLALGYHNTPSTTNPENVRGLSFEPGDAAVRRHLPELRRRADVVVVVSHQGTRVDEWLAREVDGVDLIVGGHSHDLLVPPRKVGDTWIVQAMSDASFLGELTVTVREGRVTDLRAKAHPLWADRVPDDPATARRIAQLRAPYRDRLEAVVGEAAEPIDRQYKSESPFDHLLAQALRAHTGAEVALLPGVGYGLTLWPGPVRREDLYTLLPHPVKVATLALTGAGIEAVLEQNATNLHPPDPLEEVGGLVQSAGLEFEVDLRRPPGDRVGPVRVAGAPLDPARVYRVVTHTGMLHGLHGYDTLREATDVHRRDEQVVDVFERWLTARAPVSRPAAGAVRVIRRAAEGAPRPE